MAVVATTLNILHDIYGIGGGRWWMLVGAQRVRVRCE
jgi:hypothetical protein